MKVSILVGVATVLQVVSAFAVGPRQAASNNGIIAAPVWRRDESRSVENDLARRDLLVKRQSDTVPVSLDNPPSKLLYFANSNQPTLHGSSGLTESSYDRDAGSENSVTVGYGIKRYLGAGADIAVL